MTTDLQPQSTTLAPALQFCVPLEDLADFSELPEKRRVEVQTVLPLLQRIHMLIGRDDGRGRAHSKESACKIVASASRHLRRGLSNQSLRRHYDAYLANSEWRDLIAGYKGPNKQPVEFTRELQRVAQLNNCSQGEAYQRVRERWAAGESIPGYGTWIEHYQFLHPERPLPKVWPRGFYPTGWSVRNMRRYGPSKGARALYNRGLEHAQKHFPAVRYDPSQLRPLELIVIDDFELDCLCAFAGDAQHKPQIGRVAGLLAIDVATRRKLHWGLGQRLERTEEQPDGTVKTVRTGIARIDVQLLIYSLFAKYGLPPYQVTLLVENAAAAISEDLELSIQTLFQGRVVVKRTGFVEHRNLTNGFVERGGKPMEKGWVEAAFNGLWNILGDQKGYKGNNQRLNAPGDLDARIGYTKVLFGQGQRAHNLPPEVIAQLRLPFNGIEQMEKAFAWACSLCDRRDNHKYIGFDRVTEFLLEDDGEPQPFAALALLPPEKQLGVQMVERMESPVERWNRLTEEIELTVVDASVLAVFLLTPKRCVYRNHAITFTHDRRGKREGFSFVDHSGDVLRDVQEGTEFLGYFDPSNPSQLHITQLNGARTGTLTRLGGSRGMVPINDEAAKNQARSLRAALINRVKADNAALHEEANVLLGAEREHNDAVIARHKAETAGLTTAQRIALAAGENAARAHEQQRESKALARTVQRAAATLTPEDASAFLDDEAGAAAPETTTETLTDYT